MAGPPEAHQFKHAYADRWVRFHSLPESKRYPEDETEYAIVLDRYNTVLDELFAGDDVYVVTTDWSPLPWGRRRPTVRRRLHPEGVLWTTVDDTEDTDPHFHTRSFHYADRRPGRRGCLDRLLR
ncbi:hypothetical protein [Streptomyces sp. NPDC059949]|uniref:DUF3885 domain-containing protein n=1 Tax=Streptomyces sp. NPDC059949 TaxID=3347013 RepID=UPI003666ACCA